MKRARNGTSIAKARAPSLDADIETTQMTTQEAANHGHIQGGAVATAMGASKPAVSSLSRVSDAWRCLISDVAAIYPAEISVSHWHLRDILVLLLQSEEVIVRSPSTASVTITAIDWTILDGCGSVNALMRALWLACVKECCAMLGSELMVSTHTPSQCTLLMDVLSVLCAGVKAREPIITTSAELQPASLGVPIIAGSGEPSPVPGQVTSENVDLVGSFTLLVHLRTDRDLMLRFTVSRRTLLSKILAVCGQKLGQKPEELRMMYEDRRIGIEGDVVGNYDLREGALLDLYEIQCGD